METERNLINLKESAQAEQLQFQILEWSVNEWMVQHIIRAKRRKILTHCPKTIWLNEYAAPVMFRYPVFGDRYWSK